MCRERRAAMTMMTTQWTTKTSATPVAAAAVFAKTEPTRPGVCQTVDKLTHFIYKLIYLFLISFFVAGRGSGDPKKK
jgi:predicted nucleic acid-binding Zn ribbon protein